MASPLMKNSPRGHNGYLLVSAMQKLARRSKEQEMLYCCYELEAMNCYAIMRNRLAIICYEDVGILNSDFVNSVNGHIERMDSLYKSKNSGWRLILGYLVMSICRGQKSRIVDEFISAVAFDMVNGKIIDFDSDEYDYIYDAHTKKGKKLGRGREFFFEHSVKIEDYDFDNEPNYQQMEIDSIDEAYKNGNAWDLLRQPPQKDLFS